jgi:RNA polymerase sigma-70 factor (ECF subfamily)
VTRFESVAAIVYEPLQRYLRRRAAPADAADVLSDTLATIWRRLEAVPADDPLPWCYGIARRTLSNHRRGNARRERLQGRLQVVGAADSVDGDDPQDAVEHSDPELAAAITHLSDSEREIVRLWAWERLEPREIAAVLDLTPNAVSVALTRAKRKLADELGGRNDGGDGDGRDEGRDEGHDERQDPGRAGQETDRHAVEPERSGE